MEIRYAHSGDVDVAFRTLGEGPPTLVYVAGSFTNLEVMWEHPDYRRFCERLASFARLVVFDKRGMGLSASRSGRSRNEWTTCARCSTRSAPRRPRYSVSPRAARCRSSSLRPTRSGRRP